MSHHEKGTGRVESEPVVVARPAPGRITQVEVACPPEVVHDTAVGAGPTVRERRSANRHQDPADGKHSDKESDNGDDRPPQARPARMYRQDIHREPPFTDAMPAAAGWRRSVTAEPRCNRRRSRPQASERARQLVIGARIRHARRPFSASDGGTAIEAMSARIEPSARLSRDLTVPPAARDTSRSRRSKVREVVQDDDRRPCA